MSMGFGIGLIVIGAILAFALQIEVEWADLGLIGTILMVAGAVVFLIGLVLMVRKRQVVSTSRTAVDPVGGERVEQRTTSYDDPPVA